MKLIYLNAFFMCWLIFLEMMLRFVYIIYIYFRAVKKNEFWIFVEFKIKIHIGKQRVCQWRTSCDEDEGRCRCIVMLLLACPVKHCIHCSVKILWNKRASMRRCLCQNWNQAVHTERIFCTFSRGTSISVALASRKRELDI